jgi:hypothetical protein
MHGIMVTIRIVAEVFLRVLTGVAVSGKSKPTLEDDSGR